MTITQFIGSMDDWAYLFLTINFLWGMYCIVLVWRRIQTLRFRNMVEQETFLDYWIINVERIWFVHH